MQCSSRARMRCPGSSAPIFPPPATQCSGPTRDAGRKNGLSRPDAGASGANELDVSRLRRRADGRACPRKRPPGFEFRGFGRCARRLRGERFGSCSDLRGPTPSRFKLDPLAPALDGLHDAAELSLCLRGGSRVSGDEQP